MSALDATPAKFRVPDDVRERFRKAMNETAPDVPDTAVACALFVEIWKGVVAVTHSSVAALRATLSAEGDAQALLAVGGIPLMTMVALQHTLDVSHTNTVYDVRFVFRHPKTHQPLDAGLLEVVFWRDSVPLDKRSTVVYAPPVGPQADLVAQPDWAALALDAPEFARDRERIIEVMRLVRNMHAEMPLGIKTALDLVYATNFYEPGAQKRKRGPAGGDAKRRKGGAATQAAEAHDHVGYCVIFQCEQSALPTINAAFMAHLERKIGAPLSNWLVTFAHTKPVPRSDPPQVKRRCESLAIVLRRAAVEDKDVAPHSIAGVEWLVRRIAAVESQ